MSINSLVKELKENEQDFEFYPTTEEMLNVIYPYMRWETVLDIGCGTCNFKKYADIYAKNKTQEHNDNERRKELVAKEEGKKYYPDIRSDSHYKIIENYYVIEKSKILLQQLDAETICLGTDFNMTTLIDKKVSTIFCNPPYSEFMNWTKKIITEGNYMQAFLVIPQRWKSDEEFLALLKKYKTGYDILGSFDFANAERSARAKVDVVRFVKDRHKGFATTNNWRDRLEDTDKEAFDLFFNELFHRNNKEDNNSEYIKGINRKESQKNIIKNALANSNDSRANILVELYSQEYQALIRNLEVIMQLDDDILETFDFSVEKVKKALILKLKGLKTIYWEMVLDEMEKITERLTHSSRASMLEKFKCLQTVDFTIENIYSLILWVIKNANKYYDSQLIDFFTKLSDEANVKPYKSNQRLFEKDGYYWNSKGKKDYVLDYRIIMSSPFRVNWNGKLDGLNYNQGSTLKDIKTIANNLGFKTCSWDELPTSFGEKIHIYMENGEEFLEYKVYKNGNMHIKFNQEFTKAMNVEVSRLLGWIRSKEDIAEEFPVELAKGAEKYFKQNKYISLENDNIKMLEMRG